MVYGTFSDSNEALIKPSLRPLGGDIFPQSNRLYTLTHTRIFTPGSINEFRFGYNKSISYKPAESSNTQDYAKHVFGLKKHLPQPVRLWRTRFQSYRVKRRRFRGGSHRRHEYQFTDNFRWSKGKHNIGLGFTISPKRYDEITDFNGNPSFNFNRRFTGIQGLGLGDMLLVLPFTANGALGDSSQQMRTVFYGGYVQDD